MGRVAIFSEKYQTAFVFMTNNFELSASEVAAIYQNRWQIEVFFKKLKHPAVAHRRQLNFCISRLLGSCFLLYIFFRSNISQKPFW